MSADSCHASRVHDDDASYQIKERVIDHMGNYKNRTATDKLLENFVNDVLTLRVERGCRFIQNENRRISQNRSSQSDALALPARKLLAFFADLSAEAAWKMRHERNHVSPLRGFFDLFPRRVGFAVANVLGNRIVEELRFLSDDSNLAAEIVAPNLTHVDAVDQNSSLIRIHEPGQHIQERRFSRSVFANDSDDLTRLDREAEIPQGWWPRVSIHGFLRVRERDIFKSDVSAMPVDDLRLGGLWNFCRFVEDFEDAVSGSG